MTDLQIDQLEFLLRKAVTENQAMKETLEYCLEQIIQGGNGTRSRVKNAIEKQLQELEVEN